MADLIDPSEIMFTPFEPKTKNRFIMYKEGIPAYLIRATSRPSITFEEICTFIHIICALYHGIVQSLEICSAKVWKICEHFTCFHFNMDFELLKKNMQNRFGII